MDEKHISLSPDGFNEIRMCRSGPMIYNKYDIYVGGSLKVYGEFSVREQEAFNNFLSLGDIVVEVGANIGAHTVDLSRLVGEHGAVYAFEPQRIVFQTLCANLALNQCANVFAYHAGVGNIPGTINVPAVDPASVHNFGGISLIDAPIGEEVPLMTIDGLNLPTCNMIKVDVEGMELQVLQGATRTIEKHRPVMYVENDRQEKSRELLQFVFGQDYVVYWHLPPLFRKDNFAGATEDIFNSVVSVNILCVPREMGTNVVGLTQVRTVDDKLDLRPDSA